MTITIKDAPVEVLESHECVEFTPGGEETVSGRISALQLKRLARKKGTQMFMVFVKQVDEPDAQVATVTLSSAASDDCLIPKKRLEQILFKYKHGF
jgi:hypothetical protein